MKITAEFNSTGELLNFINTFGTNTVSVPEAKCGVAQVVETKKIDKMQDGKTQDKPVDSTPKVNAEKVSEDPPKGEVVDADIKAADEPSKEKTKVTKEDLRAIFTKIIKAGKQSEAKALTTKYGAARLPDIKEEDYAAVYKDAEDLI